jgi:hypothetical protein
LLPGFVPLFSKMIPREHPEQEQLNKTAKRPQRSNFSKGTP